MPGKYLRLVDQDGKEWMHIDRSDVSSLSAELFYTIDYRPDEHPDYDDLKTALDAFLSANA